MKPSIRLREDINHLLRMIAMNENTNFHEIVRNGISSELQGRGYASLQELEAMEPDAVENLAYLVGGTDNV